MTNTPMTPDEEYDYYARPDNQLPPGSSPAAPRPARRRHPGKVSSRAGRGDLPSGQCRRPVPFHRGYTYW